MKPSALSAEERKILLRIAREVIHSGCLGLPFSLPPLSEPALLECRGAFVTIHKRGTLRGCIGIFETQKPLFEVVAEMAVSAAFHDPRFPPLRSEELPDIDIEISALTPLRTITNIEEIEVGTHGICITLGRRRGVLLPQVATEHGWDRVQFLVHTCIKAGLEPDSWKKSACRLEIFSAEVFGERSEGLLT